MLYHQLKLGQEQLFLGKLFLPSLRLVVYCNLGYGVNSWGGKDSLFEVIFL